MEKKKMAMVSDMMRALTNLFATRKGAESSYSAEQSQVKKLEEEERRAQERADRLEREAADRDLKEKSLSNQEATLALRQQQEADKRHDADEKREAARQAWNYQLHKDWLADFYKRNEIYMKSGKKVPASFDTLLQKYYRK